MTRRLVPREAPLPQPTGDGIAGLPNACWTIDDCTAHRCCDHTEAPILNTSCEFDQFAECGACAYQRGYQDALANQTPVVSPLPLGHATGGRCPVHPLNGVPCAACASGGLARD